ncbi:MAG: hypothetical protein FJY67_09785, partial [Calditrichaeota bacterium]|nr:hypothetical protein [Calditrichota bacterium]
MGRSVEHPWQEPDFVERLKNEVEGRIVRNEPLAKHTSLRVGGPADIYLYPANAGCLAALFGLCREHRIPLFVIGYGTH